MLCHLVSWCIILSVYAFLHLLRLHLQYGWQSYHWCMHLYCVARLVSRALCGYALSTPNSHTHTESKYYKRRGLTSLAPSPTNQSDATSTSGQSAHGVGRRPHQSRPPLRALLKRDDDAFLADCRRRVDQLSDVIDFESMCAITSPVVVGRRSRKRAPKEAGGTAGDDVTEELVQWEPLSMYENHVGFIS